MSRVDAPEGEAGRPCSEVHEGLPMSLSGMHEVPLLRAQEFGCILCWDCWQCAPVASANKTTKKPAQVPSLSVNLSAACAGQASLQSVKSWLFGLFGPVVNAIMLYMRAFQSLFRPFGPHLRGQEFKKMLQCT